MTAASPAELIRTLHGTRATWVAHASPNWSRAHLEQIVSLGVV